MTGRSFPPERRADDHPEGDDVVRVPDAIEPITAFKAWRVDSDLRLHSMNGQATWTRGEWTTAHCSLDGHFAPEERCACGLYAAKELDVPLCLAVEVLIQSPRQGPQPARAVVGRIQLAGKVIEHDDGYRAERARVVEILPTHGGGPWIESVAARLGVPIGEQIPASTIGLTASRMSRALRSVRPVTSPPQVPSAPQVTSLRPSRGSVAPARPRSPWPIAIPLLLVLISNAAPRSLMPGIDRLGLSGWWVGTIVLGAALGICSWLIARRLSARRFSEQLRRSGTAPADTSP